MSDVPDVFSPRRVLGPQDGELLGPPEGVMDRFLVDGVQTGGRLSLVEHRLAPGALAAPLHRHSREDEFSFVLEGRVGALLGSTELVAGVGDLVIKPRGEWHTFWNAGDSPARVLEIISPGGLEELFRRMDVAGELDPQVLIELAEEFGAEVDLEGTGAVVERHGLSF